MVLKLLQLPDMTLYDDPEFRKGISKQIEHEKNVAVLKGFLIGASVNLTFAILFFR